MRLPHPGSEFLFERRPEPVICRAVTTHVGRDGMAGLLTTVIVLEEGLRFSGALAGDKVENSRSQSRVRRGVSVNCGHVLKVLHAKVVVLDGALAH